MNLSQIYMYLGAPMVPHPEVGLKVQVLAVMNVNPARKSSRFKGMFGEVQQCESGPESLRIQRGFTGNVW